MRRAAIPVLLCAAGAWPGRAAASRRLFLLLALLCVAFTAHPAAASTPDLFGLGSAGAGEGNAVVAQASDFSAGFYNPAGLAFGAGRTASVGLLGFGSQLQIQGHAAPIADPYGFTLGFDADLPVKSALADRVRVGFALFLLPDTLIHVIARSPETPFFPYYDNRTQRLVLLPAVAVKLLPTLSFGLGFNFLAGLAGDVETNLGPTRALEPRVDEQIGSFVRLNAGLAFRPSDAWWFGLAYRQAFSVPFSTSTRNTVAGTPIDVAISAAGLYTPDEIAGGACFHPEALDGALRVEADGQWSRWSAWSGPFVTVQSELPLVGPLAGRLPAVPYNDTWTARLGAAMRVWQGPSVGLTARGGAGYETSPIPADQPGVTNLIDGPKTLLALGLGIDLPRLLPHPLRVDLHAGAQIVGSRTLTKRFAAPGADPFDGLQDEDPTQPGNQTSNPGYPSISGGGVVYDAGLTVSMAL